MGEQQSKPNYNYGSSYGAEWGGSLGDKTKCGSFGEAFKDAHAQGGSGHTFTYNGKLYSTNCADGGDYRKSVDNRDNTNHAVRAMGH